MRVAALQLTNYIGDKAAAYSAAEKLICKAAEQKAVLAALPELSACGYIPNQAIWSYAEKWPTGETARWACKMARKYSLFIGTGFLETDGKDYYNAYLLANPEGKIAGRVHKIKTEPHCFKPSDLGTVIETELGKIAIGICADNHVVTFYHRLDALNFDLLLMPHAWATPFATNKYLRQKDIDNAKKYVDTLGSIYATGFGVPTLFVNSVGEVPKMSGIFGKLTDPSVFRLRGGSAIFYPDGTATRLDTEDEGIITAEISPGRLRKTPLQPVFYGGWLHPGSTLVRKLIAPIDMLMGNLSYRKRR